MVSDDSRQGGFFTHDEFSVHCAREGDRQVVAASGQLVVTSAWQLERELRLAEATDASEILLDLAGLKFIDDYGVEVVIHACARVQYHSKRLIIGPASEAVRRMFERSDPACAVAFADRAPAAALS